MRPEQLGWIVVLAGSVAISGCGIFDGARGAFTKMLGKPPVTAVSLVATPGVNNGYPVAVDVVFVYDQTAWDALPKLRACEWFSARTDMKLLYARQLDILSWELVPGQRLNRVTLPERLRSALGAVVFADYTGTGAYRAVVQSRNRVQVNLGAQGFEVRDVDELLEAL
jgi:type VI secretion system protein